MIKYFYTIMNVFANDMKAIHDNIRRGEKERQQLTALYDVTSKNMHPITRQRKESVLKWVYNMFKFMERCVRLGYISDFDYKGFGGEGVYFSINVQGLHIDLENKVVGNPIDRTEIGLKISWIENNNETRLVQSEKILLLLSSSHKTSKYVPKFYLGGTMRYNRKQYRCSFIEHIHGATLDTHPHYLGTKKDMYKQVECAIRCMNAVGVSHGDLKEDNIMLTPLGEIKIIDFGKSTHLPEKSSREVSEYHGEGGLRSNLESLAALRSTLVA